MANHRPEHNREEHEVRPPIAAADGFEGYDAALSGAAVRPRGARGLISIAGGDAVSFLHGILTNDISGLEPGGACYAAYLTPQGRMLSDMHVLRRDGDLLLDVEPAARERLLRRLDESLFTEDVRIADRSGELGSLALLGPAAADLLSGVVLDSAGGAPQLPEPGRHVLVQGDGGPPGEMVILGADTNGLRGFHLFAEAALAAALVDRLVSAGAAKLGPLAAESLRIEHGIPLFGVDMTEDTIPLEAGIEGRAISMTKGCYVGQEVIVRILHRGGGRVAKRLVGLTLERHERSAAGARLTSDGRDAGQVTSAIVSPRLGPIALGYVHRDFTAPGTRLLIADGSGAGATVSRLPFDRA